MKMKMKINDLKEHPLNIIFGDLPKNELESLKNDIEKRGLQTIIDITEDKTIVCGHQRVKVCKELGFQEIDVRILEGWSNDKIREHLIKDNILRRQLTPDQIVEAGKELEKIYAGRFGTKEYNKNKESSNGKMLFNICRQVNKNSHFISSVEELNPEWVKKADSIGICGATSTPKWLMEKTKKVVFRLSE